MMQKALIAAGVIILLGLGYFALQSLGGGFPSGKSTTETEPVLPTLLTYASSTFSIKYPSDFLVDEAYAYDQFEGKPIAGVSFTIPTSRVEGTNLSADTYLSVESLPRAKRCTGDIYIPANVKATSLLVGSTTYSVATSTGAAAGNIYEEHVYAVEGSKPCTAVRYLVHSTNIANYDPGTVSEFDRPALLNAFDAIRDSLVLSQ